MAAAGRSTTWTGRALVLRRLPAARRDLAPDLVPRAARRSTSPGCVGLDDTLDPELVRAMWDAFLPQAENWRAMGVFGPRVEVPEDAPLQERLLGLTGRQPTR